MMRLICATLCATVVAMSAAANEPRVPPGLSPAGAVNVALLGPGVDYRLAELAARLARDGEGDLIAWDFSDGDNRPFAETGPGTVAAKLIADLAPQSQLVIVKERSGPQSFGHMMAFAAKTPARIIVWLDAHPARPDWPILAEAVKRFGDRLFVVPRPESVRNLEKDPVYATLRGAFNAVMVANSGAVSPAQPISHAVAVTVSDGDHAPLTRSQKAALVIAALAGRALATDPRRSSADLKQLVVQAAADGVAFHSGFLTLTGRQPAFGAK